MVTKGTAIFLQTAQESKQRILHPATVVSVEEGRYSIELDEHRFVPEPGEDAIIYFDDNGKFMQQSVRIDAVLSTEPDVVIGYQAVGQPISAEGRQSYRVSTERVSVTASIGSETFCPLLDVSATGFAIISTASYKVGQVIDVSLSLEGEEFSGRACVQSIRELSGGRMRYGLHGVDEPGLESELGRGLATITETAEAQQVTEQLKAAG